MNDRKRKEDILHFDKCPRDVRSALHRQIENIHSRPIKLWEKIFIVGLVVLSICGFVVCGILFFETELIKTVNQRFSLSVALVFTGASTVWLLSVLRQGVFYPLAKEIPMGVWYLCVAILCCEMFTGQTVRIIVGSIAGMVVIGFVMTWDRVRVSELRMQETVLRIALQFCDNHGNAAGKTEQRRNSEADVSLFHDKEE